MAPITDPVEQVVAALSSDLEQIRLNEGTAKEDLSARIKTQASAQKVYDQTLEKNLNSFLQELDHSHSMIDHNAELQRSLWEEYRKEQPILDERYKNLRNSITEIVLIVGQQETDEAQVAHHMKNAMSSLTYYKQLDQKLFSEVPLDHEEYQKFKRLHDRVDQAREDLEKQVKECFDTLQNIVTDTPENPMPYFIKHFDELLVTSMRTFMLLNQERLETKKIKGLTLSPIQPHFTLVEDIEPLVQPQTQFQPEAIKELSDRIQILKQDEPELAPTYLRLQKILDKRHLNKKDKKQAILTTKELLVKLKTKVTTILHRSLMISGRVQERACTPVAEKPSNQPKCGNPECHVEQNKVHLLICSRCKEAFYCSSECQTQHWPAHRTICRSKQPDAQKATS